MEITDLEGLRAELANISDYEHAKLRIKQIREDIDLFRKELDSCEEMNEEWKDYPKTRK